MKNIVNRKNGTYLSKDEARDLCRTLKHLGCTCVEHRAVCGYASHELAEKANLRAIMETYQSYTFAFTGSEYIPFEGHKALVIAIQKLPPDFETKFPNFVVIG